MKCLIFHPPTFPSRNAPLSLTASPRRLSCVISFRQSSSDIFRLVLIVSGIQANVNKLHVHHDREAWLPPPLGVPSPIVMPLHRNSVTRRVQGIVIPSRIKNTCDAWTLRPQTWSKFSIRGYIPGTRRGRLLRVAGCIEPEIHAPGLNQPLVA